MISGSPQSPYVAAIFDMDGLLVDSTPHWKTAEREVFGALGVPVSDELQVTTATMTTRQVAEFWFNRHLQILEQLKLGHWFDHIQSAGMRVVVVPTQDDEIDECIAIGATILRSLEDVDGRFWRNCG